MKVSDLDLRRDLKLDPRAGIASVRDARVLIFDAEVFGLLRQELIEELGNAGAKEFFLRLGFQQGYADFLQMQLSYRFETEINLLASCTGIQAWQGLVQATPSTLRYNRQTGDFLSTGTWTNSFEAQQHLSYFPPAKTPVCWTMMGYSSGWCTAFAGTLVITIESSCVGQGDSHCAWRSQLPFNWGRTADTYYKVYQDILAGGYRGRKVA